MIGKLLFYAILIYALTVVIIYFMQRHLQYFPNKTYPGTPASNNLPEMQEIHVTTEDNLRNLAWFAPPKEKGGMIGVFFHGNAGHIGHRSDKARFFIENGRGVLFCEYRGFGGNAGSPTEEGFYKDARACLKYLEDQGYVTSQLIFYGESIGSGVATQMALEVQPPLLILEAPFTSATDVGKLAYAYLPVDMLMKDKYDNLSKIANVKSRVLIIHGDEDGTVPLALGEKLFTAANHPKEFVTINGGGHSNLYEHHAGFIIADWLKKVQDEQK